MPKWAFSVYSLKKSVQKKEEKVNIRLEYLISTTNISEFVHVHQSLKPLSQHHPHPSTCCGLWPQYEYFPMSQSLWIKDARPLILRLDSCCLLVPSNIFREIHQFNNKSHIWKSFRFLILKLISQNSLYLCWLLAENDSWPFLRASKLWGMRKVEEL